MKTREEGGHVQAKERSHGRNQTNQHVTVGFLTPEFLLSESPNLWHFVMRTLANKDTPPKQFSNSFGHVGDM